MRIPTCKSLKLFVKFVNSSSLGVSFLIKILFTSSAKANRPILLLLARRNSPYLEMLKSFSKLLSPRLAYRIDHFCIYLVQGLLVACCVSLFIFYKMNICELPYREFQPHYSRYSSMVSRFGEFIS